MHDSPSSQTVLGHAPARYQQLWGGAAARYPSVGRFFYAWAMVAEATQFEGLEGTLAVKRWLESTTFMELPFNAYEDEGQCTLVRLDGQTKRYDLSGYFLGDSRRPIAVESKAYSTVGHQAGAYTEYLANAYSITAHDIATVGDLRREYFWVTSHPFSQTKWAQLTSPDEIREALKTHAEALNGRLSMRIC